MTRRAPGAASKELHNALLELRQAAGLTQQALADATTVTRKTINTIERGHYVPSTVLALRIARALAVEVEQVFWLPDDARAPRGRASASKSPDRSTIRGPRPREASAADRHGQKPPPLT